MNKQTDWQAEQNEPPTAEEMLAYSRGELTTEEAARVRERLQQYPELARAYTEPFPAAGAEPGDPHYVSDEEIDRRWASFNATAGGGVIWFPRFVRAIAAALIVVLGGLLWQSQMKVRRLENELAQPRVLTTLTLSEDVAFRGRGPEKASVPGKDLKLVLLTNADHFDQYKAELRHAGSSRTIWERSVVRSEDDEVEITLLRIEPGRYEIVLYGSTGPKTQRLGGYSFDVTE
jgi:hypothetical protein